MKKLLISKLKAIQLEMTKFSDAQKYRHEWEYEKLLGKESIIIEIMNEYEEIMRKPIIEEIESNFEMGILTPGERDIMLNNVPKHFYY